MSGEKEKVKPVISSRAGRFQISIWKRKRIIKAKNDFDMEREVETVRACIQYSRYSKSTKNWQNQNIWCNCDEIRDLAGLLDRFPHGNRSSAKDGSADQE